ncbi:ribonuclease BN [Altererythrobacter xixiisoli]|uniref:Ribonuclease BN n=1 Tax=Croceibacterium xixiisoli TaxID=1476466 RepID=A0A6I4TMV9_9SPHN|nr:YihY/virulence factor BrkB family protein [Croceibacterium xixiisoli]MXO97385.1 ribonuclease BN [Croceibacterium xixiisoli]
MAEAADQTSSPAAASEPAPAVPPVTTDLTPEARRKAAQSGHAHGMRSRLGPGSHVFELVKRIFTGLFNDGTIHAGNLAYMSMLAIFPFFITGAALFSLLGDESQRMATIDAVLYALPPVVGEVIGPAARTVVQQRSGVLLWIGGLFGLWTVGGLVETIRDILRRAYGTHSSTSFWKHRLLSTGIIVGAVVLLMLSLFAQVLIGAVQEVIDAYVPQLADILGSLALSRIIPTAGLFLSLYLLFYTLTPSRYRSRRYPKWPGALVATLWWLAVSVALPPLLRSVFSYDLTYGSLAGMMIALFFFWLVGLGVVLGAEFNAALAESPEEEADRIGQADDRDRQKGTKDTET